MLKKLFPYMGGYKRLALITPLLMILEVACELALPRFMANIVDVGIVQGDLNYILKMGAIMLVLALCSMTCGMLGAKFAAKVGQGFGANLRRGIYNKIQEFSFADIDRFSSASLITRITNDVNAIQMMVTMALRLLVRAPVMLVAALAVAITINGAAHPGHGGHHPTHGAGHRPFDERVQPALPGPPEAHRRPQRHHPGKPGGHPGGEGLRPGGL